MAVLCSGAWHAYLPDIADNMYDAYDVRVCVLQASATQSQSTVAIGQPDRRHLLTVLILATALQSAMDMRAAGYSEQAGKVLAMFHLLDAQQILLSDIEHVAKVCVC
jgi:hypothetical protein